MVFEKMQTKKSKYQQSVVQRKSLIKQRAISLLEVLCSLTIIALILIMAVRYLFLANNNNRINAARQQIGSVVVAIENWKNLNPTYNANLNISTLYNEGFLDKSTDMVITGDAPTATAKLYDPWGGEITVSGATDSANIATTLPKESDCERLMNSYPKATCDGKGGFNLSIS